MDPFAVRLFCRFSIIFADKSLNSPELFLGIVIKKCTNHFLC